MSLYFFPTDIYCILYSFQRNHVLKLCRLEIHIGGIYFVKKVVLTYHISIDLS